MRITLYRDSCRFIIGHLPDETGVCTGCGSIVTQYSVFWRTEKEFWWKRTIEAELPRPFPPTFVFEEEIYNLGMLSGDSDFPYFYMSKRKESL